MVAGVEYKTGEVFVPDTCVGKCTCYGDNRMLCDNLCPRPQECSPDETVVKKVEVVEMNEKCKCDVLTCEMM